MFATARRLPRAETGPLVRPVPEPPAGPVHPVTPPAPLVGPISDIAPPSARELAERAVRNAAAGLREAEICLAVACRGIAGARAALASLAASWGREP